MRRCGPRKWWRTVALGAAALLLLGQPAAAFYWYGWPGSGVTPAATITPITPRTTPKLPVGEETPPSITTIPPDVPIDPKQVPEPGTLLVTAIGLAAVGLARRWRRGRTPA